MVLRFHLSFPSRISASRRARLMWSFLTPLSERSQLFHVGLDASFSGLLSVPVGLSLAGVTCVMFRWKCVLYPWYMCLYRSCCHHHWLSSSSSSHPCRRRDVYLLRPVCITLSQVDERATPWELRIPISRNLTSATLPSVQHAPHHWHRTPNPLPLTIASPASRHALHRSLTTPTMER